MFKKSGVFVSAMAVILALSISFGAIGAEEKNTAAAEKPAKKAMKPAAEKSANVAKRVVVVWSEGTAPKNVYPNDINGAICEGLKPLSQKWEIVKANLSDPDQGLPDELLKRTDVLIWWGHQKHGDVKDELVDKIV
ncbi:MAG: hypothetical protein GX455_05260, partial [Phycisphaerae bacterium]|nr:hypothetical protein [Phycisphaerae bacterium]